MNAVARPWAGVQPDRVDAAILEPISGNAVARMLGERAEAVGLGGPGIAPRSLPAGHATAAALAGLSHERVAAQLRGTHPAPR